jgi:hypothetical protein
MGLRLPRQFCSTDGAADDPDAPAPASRLLTEAEIASGLPCTPLLLTTLVLALLALCSGAVAQRFGRPNQLGVVCMPSCYTRLCSEVPEALICFQSSFSKVCCTVICLVTLTWLNPCRVCRIGLSSAESLSDCAVRQSHDIRSVFPLDSSTCRACSAATRHGSSSSNSSSIIKRQREHLELRQHQTQCVEHLL